MKITKPQLRSIRDAALYNWKQGGAMETLDKDAFLAECWIRAFNEVLGRDGMELYAFDKTHNDNISEPSRMLDISGKIEI